MSKNPSCFISMAVKAEIFSVCPGSCHSGLLSLSSHLNSCSVPQCCPSWSLYHPFPTCHHPLPVFLPFLHTCYRLSGKQHSTLAVFAPVGQLRLAFTVCPQDWPACLHCSPIKIPVPDPQWGECSRVSLARWPLSPCLPNEEDACRVHY